MVSLGFTLLIFLDSRSLVFHLSQSETLMCFPALFLVAGGLRRVVALLSTRIGRSACWRSVTGTHFLGFWVGGALKQPVNRFLVLFFRWGVAVDDISRIHSVVVCFVVPADSPVD